MRRLLALAVLLPSVASAQALDARVIARTLLNPSWFEINGGLPEGMSSFIDAAHRAYIDTYEELLASDLEDDGSGLEVEVLDLVSLKIDEANVDPDEEEALLDAYYLGEVSPALGLPDSAQVHRYLLASGFLDRFAAFSYLQLSSVQNPYLLLVDEKKRDETLEAYRGLVWGEFHIVLRYNLRDVAPADLEAVTESHESPAGQAAVARSVEAVQELQPFVDEMMAWSNALLENPTKRVSIRVPASR